MLGNYGDLGLSFLTERFLKFLSKKPLIALNDRERNMSSKRYQFVLSSKKIAIHNIHHSTINEVNCYGYG